jgi:GTP-binding protein YchF
VDLAIVGPAQSGKTSVFNALAAGHAQRGDARSEHLAAVKIPDQRLEKLAQLVGAEKVTPVELRLHDLPTLFLPAGRHGEKGRAASGEAAESLSRADGLILVVRAFRRADVPHPRGDVDPPRDIDSFRSEMLLHDLGIVERRLEKLEITVRSARPGEREEGQREQKLLQRVRQLLEDESPLLGNVSAEEARGLANYGLLTLKPVLILINLDEDDAARTAEIEGEYKGRYGGTSVGAMCASLEAELGELEPEEAAEFRRELGATEPAAPRVLRQTQEMLGLITFYTPVGTECRAWAVPAGTTALEAAGRIHTDMERGFIRAEAIRWEELMGIGSFAAAKKQGRLRSEGKRYVVQDGDVLHILFHV